MFRLINSHLKASTE